MRGFRLALLIAISLAMLLSLSGCKSAPQKSEGVKWREFTYSKSDDIYGFVNNNIIYMETKGTGEGTFRSLNFETGEKQVLGKVRLPSGWIKNTTSLNGCIYTYFNGSADSDTKYYSDLIKIDCSTNEYIVLSNDTYSTPWIDLFSTDFGLLACKTHDYKRYFELISPDDGSVIDTLMAPNGTTFEGADVSDGFLYVLENINSENYIVEYDINDFVEINRIKINNLSDVTSQSSFLTMKVMGDYVYLNDSFNDGLIMKIDDGNVSMVINEKNLKAALGTEDIFYVLGTDECFLFDRNTGERIKLNLLLEEDHMIYDIQVSDSQVLVRTGKNKGKGIIYIYDYDIFVSLKK